MQYDFRAIEERWQNYWESEKTFKAFNPVSDHVGSEQDQSGEDPGKAPDGVSGQNVGMKPKYYVLDMFPYPSGVGLHVGHPLGYIATDIVSRFKRMQGYNVLHPMGFDAFGLPAEQFAVEHGVHPRITTEQNIANMVRQLKRLGLSYDWDRSLSTTDVDYYKWTQWIFVKLYDSWFDPLAQCAKPISDLVRRLANEDLYVDATGGLLLPDAEGLSPFEGDPPGAIKWFELDAAAQEQVLSQHRLAYLDEVPVNWCPALGTVLANEEVTSEGLSERGNHPVFKKPLKQWLLRITAYAERLGDDLDSLAWPEAIKIMQRNWIGRSEGAMVDFAVDGSDEVIRVFTTRPDTLFGATYMVLAPEHPMVESLVDESHFREVSAYQQQSQQRSDIDRMADTKEKTGVFTGRYAINPANGKKIPVWIADYVLMGYGTGAIMAVPAHDERDFAFARQFDLPVVPVVLPGIDWLTDQADAVTGQSSDSSMPVETSAEQSEALVERYLADPGIFGVCFSGSGTAVNSANDEMTLNELPTDQAKEKMTAWLFEKGVGTFKVQYKLRDWLFSRQRYWGEPFPVLHGPNGQIRTVPEDQLPVEHPHMEDFKPIASDDPDSDPQPPLGRAGKDWLEVNCDGEIWQREVNTMPQWAGSCWYYLRFLDPQNTDRFVGTEAERYWMHSTKADGTPHLGGVDLYVGGAEHAVLHLLYARFWHKVLYDLGYVSTPEPFGRLFNQGYIQAYAYTDERGVYVPAEEVEERDGRFFYRDKPVTRQFGKMGKSLKNAVTPDEICEKYGCDTLRIYEMYLGPLDQSKVWNTRDIAGPHRFLRRLWRNFIDDQTGALKVRDEPAPEDLRKLLHKTIARVTEDMKRMSFNTAIAALIELNNVLVSRKTIPREVANAMILLLSPIAPHICEELWHRMGHEKSLAYEPWPTCDVSLLVESQIELPVQVNGKMRGRITVDTEASEDQIRQAVLANERIAQAIGDKEICKFIVVPGRMVNVVIR